MSQAIQTLKHARKMISDPEHWTRGTSARTKLGHHADACSRNAYSFCLVGALYRSAYVFDTDFAEAAKAVHAAKPIGYVNIIDFNDDPDTTHADVLNLLDNAIEKAEA